MNIILLISLILPILTLSIDNNYQNKLTNKINFNDLALKDIDCLNYYETNVITRYKSFNDIPFNEYLEYWWNSEETDDELLERVCNFIYQKYPKKNIRTRKTIN